MQDNSSFISNNIGKEHRAGSPGEIMATHSVPRIYMLLEGRPAGGV